MCAALREHVSHELADWWQDHSLFDPVSAEARGLRDPAADSDEIHRKALMWTRVLTTCASFEKRLVLSNEDLIRYFSVRNDSSDADLGPLRDYEFILEVMAKKNFAIRLSDFSTSYDLEKQQGVVGFFLKHVVFPTTQRLWSSIWGKKKTEEEEEEEEEEERRRGGRSEIGGGGGGDDDSVGSPSDRILESLDDRSSFLLVREIERLSRRFIARARRLRPTSGLGSFAEASYHLVCPFELARSVFPWRESTPLDRRVLVSYVVKNMKCAKEFKLFHGRYALKVWIDPDKRPPSLIEISTFDQVIFAIVEACGILQRQKLICERLLQATRPRRGSPRPPTGLSRAGRGRYEEEEEDYDEDMDVLQRRTLVSRVLEQKIKVCRILNEFELGEGVDTTGDQMYEALCNMVEELKTHGSVHCELATPQKEGVLSSLNKLLLDLTKKLGPEIDDGSVVIEEDFPSFPDEESGEAEEEEGEHGPLIVRPRVISPSEADPDVDSIVVVGTRADEVDFAEEEEEDEEATGLRGIEISMSLDEIRASVGCLEYELERGVHDREEILFDLRVVRIRREKKTRVYLQNLERLLPSLEGREPYHGIVFREIRDVRKLE